jgi:hypothetical protein
MFGDFSIRDILLWLAGLLVAGVLVVLAVNSVVRHYLNPSNPNDPLTKQGGLSPVQKELCKQK